MACAAIAVSLATSSAFAAEGRATKGRPPAPPSVFTWTGLYVGVNFGHAWGANETISAASMNLFDATGAGFGPASALGASGSARARLHGLFAGGQIGYNWQFAERFVIGAEADLQGAGVDGGGGFGNVTPAGLAPAWAVTGASLRRNLEYLATIRGRFGFAPTPATLLYATGGVAFGGAQAGVELGQSLTPSPYDDAGLEGDRYRNLTGFVVGGGVEAALGTNISAKLEYLYYSLGTLRLDSARLGPLAYVNPASAIDLVNATSASTHFNGHLLRAGVNYRFDWSRPKTSGSAATPLFALGDASAAAETPVKDDNPLQDGPNNVSAQIVERRELRISLLPVDPLEPLHQAWKPLHKRVEDAIGLDLGLNYTSLYQNAGRAPKDAEHEAASGDLDFIGRLRLSKGGERWPRSLSFATEWRRHFTSIGPGLLGPEIGSIWGTADGFNQYSYSLTEFYWEHGSLDDGLIYRVGRMKPVNVWNRGRYVSSNHSFLNTTLANTPAMALPGAGFGAAAAVKLLENGYLLMGVHDANGANNEVGNPERGELFWALSLGMKRGKTDPGTGHYFVTLWHRDRLKQSDTPSGHGVAFHFEQEAALNRRLVPFVRYSYGRGAGLAVRQSLAVGVGLEQPFREATDRIGLAFSWAEPAQGPKRDQYGIEAFYRLAVTPSTQLTPDIQVIFNPADYPEAKNVVVGGVRLRTLF